MTEKKRIELDTAKRFLDLYNQETDSSYRIVEHSDAPDIRCRNQDGQELNLEITMTEDRYGDIPALLSRSDTKSLDALKRHLDAVERGEESIFQSVSSSDSICEVAAGRIRPKLKKDYGPNTALVLLDMSGVPWDWSFETQRLRSLLDLRRNPYDKGIWIVLLVGKRIFRIV